MSVQDIRRQIAARRAAERAARRHRDRLAREIAANREHVLLDPDGTVLLQPIDPDRFAAALDRYEREPPTGDDVYACCPLCRAIADAADGPPHLLGRQAGEDQAA